MPYLGGVLEGHGAGAVEQKEQRQQQQQDHPHVAVALQGYHLSGVWMVLLGWCC